MSEHVWVTQAPNDERLMKPIWSDASLDEDKVVFEVERSIRNKNQRGVPLPASDFPTRVAGYREPTDPTTVYNKLPHFCTSGWTFVSKEVAEVLRQFDLAGGCTPSMFTKKIASRWCPENISI